MRKDKPPILQEDWLDTFFAGIANGLSAFEASTISVLWNGNGRDEGFPGLDHLIPPEGDNDDK